VGDSLAQQFIFKFGVTSKKIIEMLKEVIHTEDDYNVVVKQMNVRGRNKLRFLLLDLLENRTKNNIYKNAS
jgi:hypothetical protein